MPKRKTAEATTDTAVTAADSRKRSKSNTVKSTVHKRTTAKKAVSTAELHSVPLVAAMPAHDEIAQLAYSYFAQRGYQPGNPREDWLRAERELTKLS